jgi:MoaA/NifB/PqqE/SkfB family radical SAM enzyme
MLFLDIDLTDKSILLCGNYGDPIYHPNFIELVTAFKEKKSNLRIITNGSYKTAEWWTRLTDVLDTKDTITFSIDGIPENFATYRINADWLSIEQGIKICSKGQCKTQWKYIPFSYNQDDIEQARELSYALGIDEFFVDLSDRFNDKTKHLKPTENLVNVKHQSQIEWKNNTRLEVDPACNNGYEHFISAEGYYAPCCMLSDYRFYYKTTFGKNKKEYSITENTLTDIVSMPKVIEFYNTIDQHKGCQYFCPKATVDQKIQS